MLLFPPQEIFSLFFRIKNKATLAKEALKKVASDDQARRNQVKKRNLQ